MWDSLVPLITQNWVPIKNILGPHAMWEQWFIPIAAVTLGGWHRAAVEQVKKLGAVLAQQHRGEDEHLELCHLFQRLSLLMKGNAALLVNRVPEDDSVDPAVNGIE